MKFSSLSMVVLAVFLVIEGLTRFINLGEIRTLNGGVAIAAGVLILLKR